MLDINRIVYIDESGVDHRLYHTYARALRGVPVLADVPGSRGKRISMIGVLNTTLETLIE
jgi:hypothetical protein